MPAVKKRKYAGLLWGFVKVTDGPFAGRVGLYDDDASQRTAVVYFGAPDGDYELIPTRFLQPTSATTLAAQRFKRKHPELVKRLGMAI